MSVRGGGFRSMCLRRLAAALSTAMLGIGSAQALEIQVGSKLIVDNQAQTGDLDGRAGIIRFDLNGPAIPGGSSLSEASGTVRLKSAAGGGLVQALGEQALVVTLTGFKAKRLPTVIPLPGPAEVGISFSHTFPNVNGKVDAADMLSGTLSNTARALSRDSVKWQAFVGNGPIAAEETLTTPTSSPIQPEPLFWQHRSTAPITANGSLMLKGVVKIKLGEMDTEIDLPNSAEVGFRPQLEPLLSSVRIGMGLLVATVILLVLFALQRRGPADVEQYGEQ